jgi:ABC-type lipoprotein export system ATPase subunit
MQPDLEHPELLALHTRHAHSGTALQLYNVAVNFGNGEPIIKDISISIFPGQVVFVRGPSGIGKSRLLRAAACLDELHVRRRFFSGLRVALSTLRVSAFLSKAGPLM